MQLVVRPRLEEDELPLVQFELYPPDLAKPSPRRADEPAESTEGVAVSHGCHLDREAGHSILKPENCLDSSLATDTGEIQRILLPDSLSDT